MVKSLAVAVFIIALSFPPTLSANDPIEIAGIGAGLTAGNMWFVPVKTITFFWGLTEGFISFFLSGGNVELTKQIWQNTMLEGPYLITPEVARTAVGERPELERD